MNLESGQPLSLRKQGPTPSLNLKETPKLPISSLRRARHWLPLCSYSPLFANRFPESWLTSAQTAKSQEKRQEAGRELDSAWKAS